MRKRSDQTINMTQGHPLRLMFLFALPLMVGNVFQQLYTVVDTIIVGRGVGLDALAALGTVDWMTWMILGIATGFTQGFSVRIAQKFGEGDAEGLKCVVAQSGLLSLLVALFCIVFGQCGLGLMMRILRVPNELIGAAGLYARVMFAGAPFVVFYNYSASVLRAVGDGKTPLNAMIAASLLNIALDCIAVFVLGWGIAGAAAATVIAQCLAGIICAIKIYRTPVLRFHRTHIRRNISILLDLTRIGTPVAVQNTIIAFGGMTVQTIVNGFGTSFIAGFTATNKLYGLLEIAALSYGYAVTTYVGQNFGAKRIDRIRTGMRSALLLSIGTAAGIGCIMICFGRQITGLFITSENPALVAVAGETAYTYLCTMALFLPVLYLLYAYRSALTGMGNTVIPMLSGGLEFILRVGVSLVVGFTGYEYGIFTAEISAWAAAMLFLAWGYYRAMHRFKKTCP